MTRTSVLTAVWALAAVAVVGAGAAGALSQDPAVAIRPEPVPTPTTSAEPSPTVTAMPPVERAQLAAVLLSRPCDGDLLDCGYGSGSVVDSSGLILTNAHVAAPASPGLATQYPKQLRDDASNPPYLVVSVVPSPEADAVPLYRATLAAVDGYADLAVLRIDATADGEPLAGPLQLTNVPLGALAETKKDAEIRVIGYPASGDSLSPTVQRGTVASKPLDTGGTVDGPWELNTNAIHGGNSGGLVVDDQGRLIAVPAYQRTGDEQVYRARAVELARPMVAAAQRGQPYRTPYLTPATGEEQLVDAAWSDEGLDDMRCVEVDEVTVAPSPDQLAVQVRLSGLADGEDYRVVVTDPAGDDVTSRQGTWGAFECVQLTVPDFAVGSGPGR